MKITKAIRAIFARRVYSVIVCVAGSTIRLEIEAPDSIRARAEAESIVEDCGFVLGVSEA